MTTHRSDGPTVADSSTDKLERGVPSPMPSHRPAARWHRRVPSLQVRQHLWFWLPMVGVAAVLTTFTVRLVVDGWAPHGDEAVIAIKAHDAWSGHLPLLGMRSTSDETVRGVWVHHPGPLELWLIGLPYRILGFHPAGLLLGCLLLALGFAGVALWCSYRAAGRLGSMVVTLILAALLIQFDHALVLPWNPWPTVLGLLAMLAVGWRILLGHRGLWPLYVFCASFVAQGHLAVMPTAVVVSACLFGYVLIRRRRRRRPVFKHGELVRTAIVGLVCWIGPLVDLLGFTPSNVQEIWRFTRAASPDEGRLLALGHVTYLLFPWDQQTRLDDRLGPGGVLVLALTGLVLAIAWRRARQGRTFEDGRDPLTPALALTTLAIGVLSWSGARSRGIQVVNLDYASAATTLHTVLLASWLGLAVRAALRRRGWAPRPALLAVATSAVVVLALLTLPQAYIRIYTSQGYVQDARLAGEATDRVLPLLAEPRWADLPITVRGYGLASWLGVAPALEAALVADGRAVHFDNAWPNREDDDFRRIRYLSGTRADVVVSERAADGEWSFEPARPPDREVTVDRADGGELRVQITISDELVDSVE